MAVARIVTRNVDRESPSLHQLTEKLRAGGYEVELAPPGTGGAGVDLLIELDQLPSRQALDGAIQLARENDADLFIAPGLFEAAPRSIAARPEEPKYSEQSHSNRSKEPVAQDAAAPDQHSRIEHSVIGETLGDIGAAVADSRAGISDSISGMRGRLGSAWEQFQQRRADAGQARRLERERRELERDDRRRQHQLELQRQAEEKQRLHSERERLAAERERVVREQMAREAVVRAERKRTEREAMARDAARRAELAHAAEQERRRLAAIEADRLRVLREQEMQRAATLAAERTRLQHEAEVQHVAVPPTALPESVPPAHDPVLDVAPSLKPRLMRPSRRMPSARERHWQRAALIASIATLAAMLGYAIAANMHPASPLPASLMQNGAQQQVPFGPARMDVSSAGRSAALPRTGKPALSATEGARQGAGVSSTTPKPSAATRAPRRQTHRSRAERNVVADDEVIVHHAPTSRLQRAQTTSGVRRYSDDN